MSRSSITAIDNCLPQTQCTRCTYPCCHDYATAIEKGEANINQCPPGGDVTIEKLALLTNSVVRPLDPQFGDYQPKTIAIIVEEKCIGCVLCIKACPVDAIVGANKMMHTVVQNHCTGCELCLPVCPTDCIQMHMFSPGDIPESDWPGYTQEDISQGRIRYQKRQARLRTQSKKKISPPSMDMISRQQAILDAVKRKQNNKKDE